MFDMESPAEGEGLRFEAAEDTEGQPKEEGAKTWDRSNLNLYIICEF